MKDGDVQYYSKGKKNENTFFDKHPHTQTSMTFFFQFSSIKNP